MNSNQPTFELTIIVSVRSVPLDSDVRTVFPRDGGDGDKSNTRLEDNFITHLFVQYSLCKETQKLNVEFYLVLGFTFAALLGGDVNRGT